MKENEIYLVIKRDTNCGEEIITKTNNYFKALDTVEDIYNKCENEIDFLDCFIVKQEDDIYFSKFTEGNEKNKINEAYKILFALQHEPEMVLNKCEIKLLLDVMNYQTNKINDLVKGKE